MKNVSFQELSFKKEEPSSSYADFLSKKAKGFDFEMFFHILTNLKMKISKKNKSFFYKH